MASDTKSKSPKKLTRKPARYAVHLNATFRVKGEEDWHRGTLINLSTGGLCLQTNAELKTHQLLELIIDTVDLARRKHRRLVLAKVVWKRLSRYGVQFVRSVGRSGIKLT